MSTCSGCGAECTRFRVTFDKQGNINGGECPTCKPGSFDPRWLQEKGAMAWEAYPEKYRKIHLEDGRVGYRATDEWQQDSEDKIRASYEKVDAQDQAAIERKRARRRTRPMSPAEIESAVNRLRPLLEERQEKNNQRWNAAISQLLQ